MATSMLEAWLPVTIIVQLCCSGLLVLCVACRASATTARLEVAAPAQVGRHHAMSHEAADNVIINKIDLMLVNIDETAGNVRAAG
jgi:hypothetical protein